MAPIRTSGDGYHPVKLSHIVRHMRKGGESWDEKNVRIEAKRNVLGTGSCSSSRRIDATTQSRAAGCIAVRLGVNAGAHSE